MCTACTWRAAAGTPPPSSCVRASPRCCSPPHPACGCGPGPARHHPHPPTIARCTEPWSGVACWQPQVRGGGGRRGAGFQRTASMWLSACTPWVRHEFGGRRSCRFARPVKVFYACILHQAPHHALSRATPTARTQATAVASSCLCSCPRTRRSSTGFSEAWLWCARCLTRSIPTPRHLLHDGLSGSLRSERFAVDWRLTFHASLSLVLIAQRCAHAEHACIC